MFRAFPASALQGYEGTADYRRRMLANLFNLTGVYMTLAQNDPETTQALQENNIRDLVCIEMRNSGIAQSRLARETGIANSRLNQWFAGKYSGKTEDILAKLELWLKGISERRAAASSGLIPESPDWKPTPTAENIKAILKYAHRMADMCIVYGGAGLGKTITARRYQEDFPNVWIATMTPSVMSVSACFERVANAVGIINIPISASRSENAIISQIKGSAGLVIIDEAQHLSVTCLDALRGLYDASGIGFVFMGNERIYTQLTGGSRKAHFAQLFSRIGLQLRLTAPMNGDIDTLLDAWGVKDKQARAICREIGVKAGALRGLAKVLRQARFMLGENEEIKAIHIEAAWHEYEAV